MKRCFNKILKNARLSYEEALTTVNEVECVFNSHPLTYMSSDDLEEPLTPPLTEVAEEETNKKTVLFDVTAVPFLKALEGICGGIARTSES